MQHSLKALSSGTAVAGRPQPVLLRPVPVPSCSGASCSAPAATSRRNVVLKAKLGDTSLFGSSSASLLGGPSEVTATTSKPKLDDVSIESEVSIDRGVSFRGRAGMRPIGAAPAEQREWRLVQQQPHVGQRSAFDCAIGNLWGVFADGLVCMA
jgi:hypothetical protein